MYVESAKRLGIDPMVWVYRKDARVVAHQGAIPVEVKLGDQMHTTGWFVETMALKSVRGGAIGSMVVQKALEDLPMNLSLGQTASMRELQFALGWQQVAPLGSYLLPLRPQSVLLGKVINPFVRATLATGLTSYGWLRRITGRPRGSRRLVAAEIDRFDDRHDQLWNDVAREIPCAVVRDASFLNWKFVDQPGQEFIRIEVCDAERVVGVAALTIREPDEAYQYRRAMLLDLLVAPSDKQAVVAVLDAACKASLERGADAVAFDVTCPTLEQTLRTYGFLRRRPTRYFLLATGGLTPQDKQLALRADAWLLTRADSDIDRPW